MEKRISINLLTFATFLTGNNFGQHSWAKSLNLLISKICPSLLSFLQILRWTYTHIHTYTYRCRYRYWFRYRFIAFFFFCFTQKSIWTWDGKISQTLYWFQNNKKGHFGSPGVNSLLLLLMPLQLLPSWAMVVSSLCSQTTIHSSTFNSEILQSHRTFPYIHCDQHFELPKHHPAWADTLIITLFGLLDFFMLLESFQKQAEDYS